MLKEIISIFVLVLVFTGCEDKTTLEKLAQKVVKSSDTNTTQTNKNKKVTTAKPVIKKIDKIILTTLNKKQLHLDFSNNGIDFKEYKGKVVIVDIFTTWCKPCKKVFPHLNTLAKKYKKNIKIIGLLGEEGRRDSEVLQFKKQNHITYPITNSKENIDFINNLGGVAGYPTIVIFDKNGTYFQHFSGIIPPEILEESIKQVLRK